DPADRCIRAPACRSASGLDRFPSLPPATEASRDRRRLLVPPRAGGRTALAAVFPGPVPDRSIGGSRRPAPPRPILLPLGPGPARCGPPPPYDTGVGRTFGRAADQGRARIEPLP